MEEQYKTLISELKTASVNRQDAICEELLAIGQSDPATAASLLTELVKFERLSIQWLIEEVVEQLVPPSEESEEEVDDPSTRPLRSSELELVYDDPRGIRLYRSKVDDRWMLIQIDPQSGMPMQQELQAEQATPILRQLAGSPYWLVPMENQAPQPPAQSQDPDQDLIYSDPNGIQIYESKSTGSWTLMRPDPMTGALQSQPLNDVMRQSIKLQLGESPYWTNAGSKD